MRLHEGLKLYFEAFVECVKVSMLYFVGKALDQQEYQ